jgi:hypothetical protein
MKLRSPIVTLLAGLLLALILWALSANAAAPKKAGLPPPASPSASSTTATPVTQQSTAAPVPAPNGTYAGETDNGAASVAIAVRSGQAIAYVCSGKVESWLKGTAADGKMALNGTHNGVLNATYSGNTATGTVTAGSQTWRFTVKIVKPPSGLYRSAAQVTNAKVVAGWIVLPNGRQVGMVDTGGIETTAPPIDTTTRTATVNGATLTATPVDGVTGTGFDGF